MYGWGTLSKCLLAIAVFAFALAPGAPADAARRCPKNTSTRLYVNPKARSKPGMKPTGVASPASCSYRTITAALGKVAAAPAAYTIVLNGAGTGVAELKRERFPLTLPAGTTLTTSDDPGVGGPGLDATRYIVKLRGAAPSALRCDDGSVTVRGVTFDGADGEEGDGVHALEGCNLTIYASRVRNFPGDGVVSNFGAALSLSGDLVAGESKIHDNGDDGIVIRGFAEVSNAEIAFNGDDGVFVESSVPGAELDNLNVRDNGGSGFYVQPAVVTFNSNDVHSNGRVPSGRSTGLPWTTVVPQVHFAGQHDFVFSHDPGDSDCFLSPNRVFSYDTSSDPLGTTELSVGLYASDGASVDATNSYWRTTTAAENVDQDASSAVDAEPMCPGGVLLQGDPFPGTPVS